MTLYARDWIEYHANTDSSKLAMHNLACGRKFTYGQMHDRVGRVADVLKNAGIEPGDRVAFLSLNTTDILEIVFGCWRMGAICLALNFRLTPPEIKFILDDADAKLVIYDTAFTPVIDALKPTVEIDQWIDTDGMGGDSAYERALTAATPIFDMHPQELEDQCMLMYSSGTTGAPKGVIITHAMMYFSPASGTRGEPYGVNNVTLTNMPLFHIGAFNATAIPALWAGAATVVQRVFDPVETVKVIADKDIGITTLFMVPAAYNAMRAVPGAADVEYSNIKVAICGAETVPTALVHWWLERGLKIQEGYGMTETTAAGCFLQAQHVPDKVGSAGKSLMHSTIRIAREDGSVCDPNEQGEIQFKGLSITPGYWRRPEATKESFVDGWFKSGDIGRMDEEGFIYIDDRIKDMYISGGENVYPAEIENLLYQMDAITEVAVIGLKDERWGETGCVCAVIKPDASLTLEQILAHLEGKLAKYKLPQYLHIMDLLPRNATGKVQKFNLRKIVPEALNFNSEDGV